MFSPQRSAGGLRGSHWSVRAAASNTPGLHINGVYSSSKIQGCHVRSMIVFRAAELQTDRSITCWVPPLYFHLHCLILFQLLEEEIVTFVKRELRRVQRVLSPHYPECSESQSEDEDEEQRRSREAFLKITLHFLRRMKQEELADCLQSSKRIWTHLTWWKEQMETTWERFTFKLCS